MSQEVLLWYCYHDVLVALHHTLATQSGIDARSHSAVDVIFFFVRNLRQVIHASLYVHMAGAAAAYTAAVMLKLYIVVQCHIQHRLPFYRRVGYVWRPIRKLKGYIYNFHLFYIYFEGAIYKGLQPNQNGLGLWVFT